MTGPPLQLQGLYRVASQAVHPSPHGTYYQTPLSFEAVQIVMLDKNIRSTLIRSYYFAEALALYAQYYAPLVSTYSRARKELVDPGRHADRPPTWVPLVFHCTTEKYLGAIFEEGALKPGKRGTVSLTEIPIGELDRMKYRHHDGHQVAIGFPRRYLESLGFSPVLYLKHNQELRRLMEELKEKDLQRYNKLALFIDSEDDVSPFQEIRTTSDVSIENAVWILTTNRKKESPFVPDLAKYEERYGRINTSFWHRTHQLGILTESQFMSTTEEGDPITNFQLIGELYWKQLILEEKEINVTLPVHTRKLLFNVSSKQQHERYTGPWGFIDAAREIARILQEAGEMLDKALLYRIIEDITSI